MDNPPPPTSTTLLHRLCNGEEFAYDEFFTRYRNFISGIANTLKIPGDSDDICQQTMLAIFEKNSVARFDPAKGRFHSYLYKIVENKCRDLIRKKQRDERIPDFDETLFQETFDAEYHNYILSLLLDELKTIVEPGTFEAFYLVHFKEIPPKEVAAALDISVASVYKAKSRCVAHLTDLVKIFQARDPEFTL